MRAAASLALALPLLASALPRTLQPAGGPPLSRAAPDPDGAGQPVHTQLAADRPASILGQGEFYDGQWHGEHSQEERSVARMRLPNLIIQYGETRTASTLQFQTLCAVALVLNEANPSRVDCSFKSRDDVDTDPNGLVSNPNGLRVWKTHTVPSEGFPKEAWLFTSEIDHEVSFDDPWQDAAERMSQKLGHDVKYTQVLSRLTGRGSGIATEYKAIFGLSDPQVEEVVTYLRYWDVLRMCCGAQMNDGYRAELISNLRPNSSETAQSEYPACDMYRIQGVERQAVQTRVFKLASNGGFGSRYLRGTSSLESDEGYDLNGQYCAWFNRQVACQELPFNQLPENPGCDGEKFPRASKGVRASRSPPPGEESAQAREELDGYAHDDEGSGGGPKQLRMHHIPDCQMCGVDWCAKVSHGECTTFVPDDGTHVVGAALTIDSCGNLTAMTPYCVAGSPDLYAATENHVPSLQQQQQQLVTTSEPAALAAPATGKDEHGICAKPENWCVHDGSTNEPKRCGGHAGHFCHDTAGWSGFKPCNSDIPATWGVGVTCSDSVDHAADHEADTDKDGMCPRPADWCVQGGNAISRPTMCNGRKGHFCFDLTTVDSISHGIGFYDCRADVPDRWGYGVQCLESGCACSSACHRDAALRSSSGHCGQALTEEGCTHERLTPPSQPGAGIVVLERNQVYRVDDMVYCDATSLGCMRARLDARTILCETMYRGTLLRRMLARVTDEASISEKSDCERGCEKASSAIAEPDPGYAYMSYRDAETALQGQGNLLSAAGPTGPAERLKVLSRLVEEGRGDCTPAAEHELVVPLRMGDMLPSTPEEVVESVRDALARPVMQNVTSVVFNAVMHYGANGMTGNFIRTPDTDAANMAFVNSLSQRCAGLGVPISFRSEPSVDTDLCYLVHSPHVMIAAKTDDSHSKGGTFPLLVAELRAGAKGAQRHTLLTRPWSTVDSQAWSDSERRAVSGLGPV